MIVNPVVNQLFIPTSPIWYNRHPENMSCGCIYMWIGQTSKPPGDS